MGLECPQRARGNGRPVRASNNGVTGGQRRNPKSGDERMRGGKILRKPVNEIRWARPRVGAEEWGGKQTGRHPWPCLSHSRMDCRGSVDRGLGDRASGSSFLWILQRRGPEDLVGNREEMA